MIRQTGGLACAATWTRSRSCSRAMASASGSGLIPIWAPSGPTSRTSRARMRSLIRGSLVACGAAISDPSSCVALVLPDALFLGTKRTKGERRMSRHPPVASNLLALLLRGVQGGHRPGRTELRPVAGWGTPPYRQRRSRFPISVVRVGYQSVSPEQHLGARMSLWTPGGEHPVDRDPDSTDEEHAAAEAEDPLAGLTPE